MTKKKRDCCRSAAKKPRTHHPVVMRPTSCLTVGTLRCHGSCPKRYAQGRAQRPSQIKTAANSPASGDPLHKLFDGGDIAVAVPRVLPEAVRPKGAPRARLKSKQPRTHQPVVIRSTSCLT